MKKISVAIIIVFILELIVLLRLSTPEQYLETTNPTEIVLYRIMPLPTVNVTEKYQFEQWRRENFIVESQKKMQETVPDSH